MYNPHHGRDADGAGSGTLASRQRGSEDCSPKGVGPALRSSAAQVRGRPPEALSQGPYNLHIYMYIYILYIHIHIYIYIYIYVSMCVYLCVYVCMYVCNVCMYVM